VRLERKLWKLVTVRDAAGAATGAAASDQHLRVRLAPVAPGSTLDTDTLYLDEVVVRSERPLRHALVEVALPPGAAVESGTWGIDIEGDDPSHVEPLERAQQQDTRQGYAVPFDELVPGKPIVVRHLVRFAQRGDFKLPPTRLHQMYDVESKAFDTSGAWARVKVQ